MSNSTSLAANPPLVATDRLRGAVLAINILYALACLTVVTSLIGLVLAYMRRTAAAGTVWEGHITYAIRTFWLGLVISVAGVVLSFVGIGLVILALGFVWYVVRVVRGFVAWSDGRAIANPRGFF